MYDELRTKGVEFPMTDLEHMAPILTPKARHTTPQHQPQPVQPQSTPDQGAAVLAKLRTELDIVQGNVRVLREMLSELHPGKESDDDLALLIELHATCRQMQERCTALLGRVQHEQVISEFSKPERYFGVKMNCW